jgi:hypothetical protein
VLIPVTLTIIFLLYLARRTNSPAARSRAAVTPWTRDTTYNPAREAVIVQNSAITDLPSYDEVQANKDKYAVQLPPPYPILQPSDAGATAV